MTKELKALSRIKKNEFYVLSHYEYDDDFGGYQPVYEKTDGLSRTECFKIVRQGLQRLEAIENANPSEVMEDFNELEEILSNQKLKYKGTIDFNLDTIKNYIFKTQESKQYLKWEDLEFEENKLKKIKVKMGNHVYTLEYQSYKNEKDNIIEVVDLWVDQRCISRNLGKYVFNDLRLERVK